MYKINLLIIVVVIISNLLLLINTNNVLATTNTENTSADDFSEFSDNNDSNEDFTNNIIQVADPFESINRFSFKITKFVDVYAISYVDFSYKLVFMAPIRTGFVNFINNFNEPIYATNDVLQLRYKSTTRSITRFILNSTLGFLGFIDVASKLNLPLETNGLGYTLAYYNIGDGFYIFVPILGPYTLKNGLASIADGYYYSSATVGVTHINYLDYVVLSWGQDFLLYLNNRDTLNAAATGSIDEYSLLKSAYIQSRMYKLQQLKSSR